MAPMHQVEQLASAPAGVCHPKLDQLLDDGGIGLPGGVTGPAGEFEEAALAGSLEPVNPLALVPRMGMGGSAGNAEALGQVADGVGTSAGSPGETSVVLRSR